MKKITIFLVLILLCVSTMCVGCKKDDNVIRVNEVTHSIFYAPMYIAMNKGYFEDEGLKIELTNGGGADASMTALLSNSADIGLMGPEAAIYVAVGKSQNQPVIFGQLTKRDGSFLIGRNAEPNFDWKALAGKEIIGGRRGGVPAMTLQYALEQNGLTLGDGTGSTTYLNTDVAFNLTASAFDGGQGDYCTLFEPTASEFVAAGKGHIVASVGEESGEVPYTAFMAKQDYIDKNPEKVEKFLKAIIRGYRFLTSASEQEIYNAIAPSFDGASETSIKSSISSYVRIDAWKSTPIMNEADFNRLQDIMQNAGELSERVSFSTVVNNAYAEKAMQEMN